MKHYIWLSLLLALGVVQAADKTEEAPAEAPVVEEKAEAGAEKGGGSTTEAEEAPAEEKTDEATTEDAAAAPADEDAPKKSKKSKKSKGKGKKSRRNKHSKGKGKKGRKHHHRGSKAKAPSPSVMNAYMNRVQSGEMCGTAPTASMGADQGGCATGNCGLPMPEQAAPGEEPVAA